MNPRVVRAVREHAQTIIEAAGDTFVLLGLADGFVEPGSVDDVHAALPECIRTNSARVALRDLADGRAAVRVVAVDSDCAWVGVYHAEKHVPESPIAWACISTAGAAVTRWSELWEIQRRFDAVARSFPSLGEAPGVRPIALHDFARWALTQPPQTAAAAACAIELGTGLRHDPDGPVAELFETLGGGLSCVPFDDVHRLALRRAARMVGRALPAAV